MEIFIPSLQQLSRDTHGYSKGKDIERSGDDEEAYEFIVLMILGNFTAQVVAVNMYYDSNFFKGTKGLTSKSKVDNNDIPDPIPSCEIVFYFPVNSSVVPVNL